jgi:hypothetical protein
MTILYLPYFIGISHASMLDGIKEQIGEEYYVLRTSVELSDGGQFMGQDYYYAIPDEQRKKKFKDNYIIALRRLLFDKTITHSRETPYEMLEKSPSNFLITEIVHGIRELLGLMMIGTSYKADGGGFSAELAKDDKYKEIIPVYKNDFIATHRMMYQVKKIELQMNGYKMNKMCFDIWVEDLMYRVSKYSKPLNNMAINTAESLLENKCIYVGILANYSGALSNEVKFANSNGDVNLPYIEVYDKYYHKVVYENPNNSINYLNDVVWRKFRNGDRKGAKEIILKILDNISIGKISLRDKYLWKRLGLIRMFGMFPDDQIASKLKNIISEKGIIFFHDGEEITGWMKEKDKQFLQMIFPSLDLSKVRSN